MKSNIVGNVTCLIILGVLVYIIGGWVVEFTKPRVHHTECTTKTCEQVRDMVARTIKLPY